SRAKQATPAIPPTKQTAQNRWMQTRRMAASRSGLLIFLIATVLVRLVLDIGCRIYRTDRGESLKIQMPRAWARLTSRSTSCTKLTPECAAASGRRLLGVNAGRV